MSDLINKERMADAENLTKQVQSIRSEMDEIQNELGSLSIASDNQKLASEFSKSPRFRGVRADLGVVARDQAEVVSATLSGLRRREARSAKGKAAKKDKDSKN